MVARGSRLQGAAGVAGALALPALLVPRMGFAAPAAGEARFVLVLLRGALDGLAAAPPVGDPHYASLRGGLALDDTQDPHRLDDLFALHPSLGFMPGPWQPRHLPLIPR